MWYKCRGIPRSVRMYVSGDQRGVDRAERFAERARGKESRPRYRTRTCFIGGGGRWPRNVGREAVAARYFTGNVASL